MSDFLIVIIVMALIMCVFAVWNHVLTRRLVKYGDTLNDSRYFELKTKQEFIIAVGAILISAFAFFGFQTINDAKSKILEEYKQAREDLISLTASAKNIDSIIKVREDKVKYLEMRMRELQKKNIIQQNIYIVERLKMGDYKADAGQYRTIYFKDLKTVSGENLPKFSTPPSILFASRTQAWPLIKDVTNDSFKINVEMSVGGPDGNDSMDNIVVDIWISQRSTQSLL